MQQNKPKFKLIAKTLYGLEPILADEIKRLGVGDIELKNRAVTFYGDQTLLYRANLWLRTALRVLKPIHEFRTRRIEHFYKSFREIDWRRYLDLQTTFAVDSVVGSQYFKHSKYVALKAKDAIVDQFRDRTGRRPSVDVENPDLRINVHIFKDVCTLSLDSSGEALHKRGYRLDKTAAPLNEALAAGLILLTGWDRKSCFIDPMCGSGTLLIEAAAMACQVPPGLHRKKFGFQKWPDYDADLWKKIKQTAAEQAAPFEGLILGSDKSTRAIESARENIKRAQMQSKIELLLKPFEALEAPEPAGMLLMNPPYGTRMKSADIGAFYQMIGDCLKQRFNGFEAWILSANKEALKHIGLRPSKKVTVFNGGLECRFQKYELYAGSKKKKYQTHD